MKRWIHASTDAITKEDIRQAVENDWSCLIDTPDCIAYADDDYGFYVIDLNKAVDFLNSNKGKQLIDDGGNARTFLIEAYHDDKDCGVTRYNLPDQFGFDSGDVREIAKVYKKLGLEVPEWLYE